MVAANLRMAVTVIGPLVPIIRDDLGTSNVALGLVGTLPLLAFGVISAIAPALGRRMGIGRALAVSLVVLAIATVLRSAGGFGWLVAGTIGLGVAIAIGNVLLPGMVKDRFPTRATQLTSVYGAMMVLAATGSAAIAVPLAERWSWEVAAGIWALPAVLGAVVLVGVLAAERRSGRSSAPTTERGSGGSPTPVDEPRGLSLRAMHRHPLAWAVTAFMGLQSTMYFVVLTWLPDIQVSRGMGIVEAGLLVGLFNGLGVVGVLVAPHLDRGRGDQVRSTAISSGVLVLGAAALLVPGTALAVPAAVLLGLGTGGCLTLALSFFLLRTTGVSDAAALSGMAQAYGYLLTAVGPVTWGAVRDVTGSWHLPVILLVVVAATTVVTGLAAAGDRVITR